jgi:FKBP-type peptidyl-prolyl cis-trans isomerase
MKLEINNRLLIITPIILCIIGIAYYGISRYNKRIYENNAKELKINIHLSGNISSMILQDYCKNWGSAIFNNRAQDEDGEWTYCSNFNVAISWRHSYYEKRGGLLALDTLSMIMEKELSSMTTTPTKYKDCQKAFIEAYNAVKEMADLCKSPKGDYQEFASNISTLYSTYTTKVGETDIYLPKVSDDELTKKFDELINNAKAKYNQQKEDANKKNVNYIAGKKFLEINKRKSGVITLSNGLQYKIIKKGHGLIPTNTSKIMVNYEGRLIDGEVFDSTNSKPIEFQVNQIIQGLKDALTRMPVGSIWEIYIPQDLAYGEREAGIIKPFSTLLFKIQLLSIKK